MSNATLNGPALEERERIYYQLKFLAIAAEGIPHISDLLTEKAAYGMGLILDNIAERIFPEIRE